MTDDLTADEAEYLKREQARFNFYRKIESLQQQQEPTRDLESLLVSQFLRAR